MRLMLLLSMLGLTAAAARLNYPTLDDCYDMVSGALPPSALTLPVPCRAPSRPCAPVRRLPGRLICQRHFGNGRVAAFGFSKLAIADRLKLRRI